MRTPSDVGPSPRGAGAADPPPAAPAEQVLVGLGVALGEALAGVRPLVDLVALVGVVDSSPSTVSSSEMPGLGQRVGDGLEDVTGELDVAQHVGHLLGVDAALLAAPLEQRLPLGGVDALHRGRLHGNAARALLGAGVGGSVGLLVTVPGGRAAPSDDAANLATTPLPLRPGSGRPSSSRCSRASASSRTATGSPVARRLAQLASDGGGDEVAGLGLGIDVEVGDRGPLQHLAGLGVGGLDGRRQVAVGGAEGEERPAVGVVGEQLLDEPAGDRLPLLDQHGDGDELGVLRGTAVRRGGVATSVGRRVRCSATRTRSPTGSPTSLAIWPA